MSREKVTHERLIEILDYDQESGIFAWKLSRSGQPTPGNQAGHVCKRSGYRLIGVDGVIYKASRLAWFYVHEEWPVPYIDHADCDRSNDKLGNLRQATAQENLRNSSRRKDNTSGVKGVSWNTKRQRWVVTIQLDRRQICLGSFLDISEAAAAYAKSASELFGAFANIG